MLKIKYPFGYITSRKKCSLSKTAAEKIAISPNLWSPEHGRQSNCQKAAALWKGNLTTTKKTLVYYFDNRR